MSNPLSNTEGTVALVTGGAKGIGAAVTEKLAGLGARLVIADVDEAAGKPLADRVGGRFVQTDVREVQDNFDAVLCAQETFGQLDLVYLNAGVTTGCGVGSDFDLERYRRVMGINLDGVVFGINAALPALQGRPGAQIVVTASLAGLTSVPVEPLYSANKHAVVGLVRSLGPTLLSEHGIRINALCPGFVDTTLLDADMRTLLKQLGLPLLATQDVVEAFLRIINDERSGECWYVQVGRPSEPFRFRRIPGPRATAQPPVA